MKGVNIGGVNINNLRYADDTVLLAEGPMFRQALLAAVNEKGKPCGMEMNLIKTKSMVISRKKPVPNISISIEGKPIQQVDRMVYLGYMATEDGKRDKEIKRIGIARTAFESVAKILTSRNVSIELRSSIAKCCIWSTLLYRNLPPDGKKNLPFSMFIATHIVQNFNLPPEQNYQNNGNFREQSQVLFSRGCENYVEPYELAIRSVAVNMIVMVPLKILPLYSAATSPNEGCFLKKVCKMDKTVNQWSTTRTSYVINIHYNTEVWCTLVTYR